MVSEAQPFLWPAQASFAKSGRRRGRERRGKAKRMWKCKNERKQWELQSYKKGQIACSGKKRLFTEASRHALSPWEVGAIQAYRRECSFYIWGVHLSACRPSLSLPQFSLAAASRVLIFHLFADSPLDCLVAPGRGYWELGGEPSDAAILQVPHL